MSIDESVPAEESFSTPTWQSYLTLCKPKVVSLIAFTALVGMLLANAGMPDLRLVVSALVGISLAAASGAAINHLVDRRIDRKMARTFNRPLPQGEIEPSRALGFALVLGAAGLGLLVFEVNTLTAILTALSLVGYAIIYSVYLKHATPYNIVWGGAAGAAPPLLGWVAVTGTVDIEAAVLFLIIFIWTPPHFWALAIKRREDYARAGVPMLPVTHGVTYTKRQIVIYTVALIVVTVGPFVIGMSGYLYLVSALVLGAGFLRHALKLLKTDEDEQAMVTFRYSVLYLMWLFAALLGDHVVTAVLST